MDHSRSWVQHHQMASFAWKATQSYCSFNETFKKPLMKPAQERKTRCEPRCKLPISCSLESRKSVDIILAEACKKLETVKVERYIMRQQAKIEGCKKGVDQKQLKHLEWFDYSGCPKKYV